MGNRGERRTVPWRAVLAALLALAVLTAPAGAVSAEAKPAEQLQEVFDKLEAMHVGGASAGTLRDAAISGMLEALNDPYTQYYNDEQWQELLDAFEQNSVGIGIRFVNTADGLLILRVFESSAAEAAGLVPGDIIIQADGVSVAGLDLDEVADMLVGPEGSSLRLTVADGVTRILRTVTITRQPFHIPSVESDITEGGIGIIRISSFSSDTAGLVREALERFAEHGGWSGLLIDLRGNPGGYMDAVIDVASLFIKRGPLLFTVGRDGKENAIEIRDGSSVPVPVALLVDEGSASASEVFAGAMQDYSLAKLVGARTYGKGSVQQLVALETGGGLRVTVEHYLTPRRRPVNGIGIAPDTEARRPLEAPMAALREIEAKGAFRVEMKAYETVVNGFAFNDVVPVVRENGKVYVSSRALAAIIGGEASWDGAAGAVAIEGKLGSAIFGTGGGLLMQDGMSYVEANAFAQAFRGTVKASAGADSVVLEWNE